MNKELYSLGDVARVLAVRNDRGGTAREFW